MFIAIIGNQGQVYRGYAVINCNVQKYKRTYTESLMCKYCYSKIDAVYGCKSGRRKQKQEWQTQNIFEFSVGVQDILAILQNTRINGSQAFEAFIAILYKCPNNTSNEKKADSTADNHEDIDS